MSGITVLEEQTNIRYLVLPWSPDVFEDGELSEEALEAVAGGALFTPSTMVHQQITIGVRLYYIDVHTA